MVSTSPGAGWHLLGELKLPASANVNETLIAWLAQAVAPIHFQPELSARLADSAVDAVDHATAQIAALGRLRILVFVEPEQVACDQNWGFFRLERTNIVSDQENNSEHIIELYLYPEG